MKATLVFALISFTATIYAQPGPAANPKKKDELPRQARQINDLLRQYDKLSPFSEKDIGKIEPMGNEIVTRLLKLLNDERIVKYDLEKLLAGDELSVSRSADKRIWFFSIDEKTGGTYRTSKTIVYYQLLDERVKAELLAGEDDATSVSTYGDVHLLDSITGTYFALGGVVTCSTCIFEFACTIKPDTNGINMEIVAAYDGRYYNLQKFEYNAGLKELYFEYESSDAEDSLYGSEAENNGLQTIHKSRFRYMKGMFVEVEKCETVKE